MASKFDQTKFRTAVRVLRYKGIISAKTDATKAEPFWIRNGKTLKELVAKYDDVISGKADVFKISDTKEKGYRKLYARSVEKSKTGKKIEYIIVPHSADERATLRNGKVVISHPAGIDRLQVPVEYHNLQQWLTDSKNQKYAKEKGVQYGFRFFGGSSFVFRTPDLMWDELEQYRTIQEAVEGDASFQRDVYRNIEIVKILDKNVWETQRAKNKSRGGRAPKKVVKKKAKKKSPGKGRKRK